jgi:Flp pilus assembly protein TadG
MKVRTNNHSAQQVTWALRLLRRFVAIRTDTQGVAATELAIIAPVLALMMICTADLGLGIFHKMQVQNAAQAGAQYAALYGFNASSISNAVLSATGATGITASPEPSKFCGCPTSTGISTTTCSTDATCSAGTIPATYVKVSAQTTYNALLPYPLIPRSFTFTAQSTVKIQ